MKWIASLIALAGCIDQVDERWQLDHDHVIAVRATPPRIMPGEHAVLDALVARAGGPTTIETARSASTPTAPAALQGMVSFDGVAWIVTAPDDAALASSRPAMGIDPGAPVPLDLLLVFPRPEGDPLYVTKTVWLGAHAENPAVPEITIGDAPAGAALVMPLDEDVYVATAVDATARVNWLTSCGTLHQDDVARAYLRADEAASGELAVVVRDTVGGVAWRVWPLAAR
jgi:hypothetical protein